MFRRLWLTDPISCIVATVLLGVAAVILFYLWVTQPSKLD